MTVFVLILGILILAVGLVVLASPGHMRRAVGSLVRPSTLPVFAIVRIAFGIALVMASAETRLPVFVWAFGLLLIIAGASLPVLGIQRVLKLTEWWLEKPHGVLRGWSLLAILLGALLIWAAT